MLPGASIVTRRISMKATTHIGFAGLLYLILLTTAGVGLTALNALAVATAAVIPDIDSGASLVGRVFPPLTRAIERKFGHRTLTHSLSVVLCLALLSLVPLLAGIDVFACVILGYASHLILDTCTPNGVRLFYPFSRLRCVFPFDANSPHRFRVPTGSRLDSALAIFFFTACIPALYVAAQGYERFIRVAEHSVESAVRDYGAFAPSGIVYALMDAHDQLSGGPLKGRFRVVGALNPRVLLFEGPDRKLHAVGRDFESEYVADNIVCEKGEPASAAVRTVEMGGRLLGSLGEPGDTLCESYFFGEVATAGIPVILTRPRYFNPVTGSGKTLRLNYARERDLSELNLDGVLATGGTVIVKTVRRAGPPSPDAVAAAPSGGVLIDFMISSGEKVELRKQKGDTVRAGDILAVRAVPENLDEQRALNGIKRESADVQDRVSVLGLDREIADAMLASASDSLEFANSCELVKRGYAPPSARTRSELKWSRTKRSLEKLLATRTLMAGKVAMERARMAVAESGLRVKEGLRALRYEFRSPYAGILLDIRRVPSGGKEKLVCIIMRFAP